MAIITIQPDDTVYINDTTYTGAEVKARMSGVEPDPTPTHQPSDTIVDTLAWNAEQVLREALKNHTFDYLPVNVQVALDILRLQQQQGTNSMAYPTRNTADMPVYNDYPEVSDHYDVDPGALADRIAQFRSLTADIADLDKRRAALLQQRHLIAEALTRDLNAVSDLVKEVFR
jgi:hypothetical protein